MNIIEESNVNRFKAEVNHLLVEREAENNLPLGLLRGMDQEESSLAPYLLYIKEAGKTTCMTMRTPPHLWILPSISTASKAGIEHLVQYLLDHEYDIPGVLGEEQAVEWFIEACHSKGNLEPNLHMRQGIYKLEKLATPPDREGNFVRAEKSDLALAKKWFLQYGKEVGEAHIEEQASDLATDMIEKEKMFFWTVNGIPVSMACRARETLNGATINAVFTPDEHKRKGYGSLVTYHLSKYLLEKGFLFCSLYTDMDNATSNSIYQKIGYRWVGNSIVYHLHSRKT
ncbi:GNAT family N-acetyltransferase [Halobacillus salinus]|uniref:GNAT family N-acetyltransferase n=1 Tax=Halobacillus salinus TaxID=192814 RepID=A0A4Z0H1D4_9BACI|nr:GNAT family N-acetyltransferase [Halobacillus salinus]TGB02681.1 GNAT family N-acetyltransferase [Halobacillus salinus]